MNNSYPIATSLSVRNKPVSTALLSAVLQRDTLKALTLTEPWASLMRHDAKQVETRSWTTHYRGPVAIHAAKTLPKNLDLVCEQPYFAEVLKAHHHYRAEAMFPWRFPIGKVVAIGMLEDVQHTEQVKDSLTLQEQAFGNYAPGRYAWRFSAIYPLKTLIPVQGALWLWNWTPPAPCWDEIQEQLTRCQEVQP